MMNYERESAGVLRRAQGVLNSQGSFVDLIMGNKSHLCSASTEAQLLASFQLFLISIMTVEAFLAQLILQGQTLLQSPSEDTLSCEWQHARYWSNV